MTLFLLIVLAAVSGLIAYISLQPNSFKIARSAIFDAPPDRIYPEINDFHNWEKWSPWARLDPDQKTTYGGSPLGAGSTLEWSGNNKVGAGRMTIKESSQNERVRIKIEFFKPMQAVNDVQFDLKPIGETKTEVVWAMSGRNEFMAKAMHAFMNMDKMVGGQFEQGLANLKAIVEAAPKALPSE
ncbi:SRPBCC family protein [Methylocystis sp. JAN1]|uniref:SRPBCC family protein n=1 Tax=Methylocystis sp. JAN1 TaxID=3397211 RepID=UPI003FA28428